MSLDLDAVTALGIVVAETTSNAYLHAFPDRDRVITVSLMSSDGKGILTIADNGIGFIERAPAANATAWVLSALYSSR